MRGKPAPKIEDLRKHPMKPIDVKEESAQFATQATTAKQSEKPVSKQKKAPQKNAEDISSVEEKNPVKESSKNQSQNPITYKVQYVKMILADIPDNALIPGHITVQDIIMSIIPGQVELPTNKK